MTRRSRVGRLASAALCIVTLVLAGCETGPVKAPDLPPPIHATTLGTGDEIEIRILGASIAGGKEIPSDYKVAPDGTVNLPFIGRVTIANLEPNEVEDLVKKKLIEGDFYTNPEVSVYVKAYLSKRVSIAGQVKKPDSYPITPGMGLLKLISLAGGFTDIADEDSIIIQRKTAKGETKIERVSFDDIRDGRIADVLLQAGDYIEVRRSVI